MINKIKIVTNKISIKKPTVIFAFPGVGLVGSIVGKYLVEQLSSKQIGHVESPHLPPVSFIQKGRVYDSIRIYESKKEGMLIVTSEFPVPQNVIFDLGEAFSVWSKEIKAKNLVCIEGLKLSNEESVGEVFAITNQETAKLPVGFKPVESGYILGVSAALMLKSKKFNLPAICYMVQSHADYPDGLAAAGLIKNFNKLFNLTINVKPLEEEANLFESKLKEFVKQTKSLTEQHLPKEDNHDNLMYG